MDEGAERGGKRVLRGERAFREGCRGCREMDSEGVERGGNIVLIEWGRGCRERCDRVLRDRVVCIKG